MDVQLGACFPEALGSRQTVRHRARPAPVVHTSVGHGLTHDTTYLARLETNISIERTLHGGRAQYHSKCNSEWDAIGRPPGLGGAQCFDFNHN